MVTGQKKNVLAQCRLSLFYNSNSSQEGADKLTGLTSLQYQTYLTCIENTRHSCLIFMVQSLLPSPLLLILGNRDCSSKPQLNHYTQSWMTFAETFTQTSKNLFPPILQSWLFSTNHCSCPTSWDTGPLSLAVMFPYTGPQSHPIKFLFRVAIIQAKRERTGSSLLSSLVPSLHTFTENLCSKFVTYKPSS